MWKRLFLCIFILLAFEVGLFLMVVPWSPAWENNFLFNGFDALKELTMNPYLRGAISGMGLLNIFAGLGEAWHFRDRIREMEAREADEAARLSEPAP